MLTQPLLTVTCDGAHDSSCRYRGIDAANDYNNEHEVGEAIAECIAEGIVTREDLFIQVPAALHLAVLVWLRVSLSVSSLSLSLSLSCSRCDGGARVKTAVTTISLVRFPSGTVIPLTRLQHTHTHTHTCHVDAARQAKLWNTNHRPEHAKGDLEQTLKDLQVDYLDSWVIHWPMAVPSSGKFCATRVQGSGAKTDPWKENSVSCVCR